MKQLFLLLMIALVLSACDAIETGDPPTISSFSARALNEDQIQLSWEVENIDDDLIESFNLKAGIWISADGLNVDNLGSPDFTTAEGALSYTVVGLDAATEYDVLVRVNDRVLYSEAVAGDIASVTTLAEGAGTGFGPAIATTNIGDPVTLVVGRAVTTSGNVGLLFSDRIDWYAANTSNTLEVTSETTTLGNIGGSIRDARLIPVVADATADHLFVVASSGLVYYDDIVADTGVQISATAGIVGTFTYRLENGVLDVFSFMGDDRDAHMFQKSTEDGNVVFSDPGKTYDLNDSGALFTLAKLDDDAFYDAVIFDSSNQVRIALGTKDDLTEFGSETVLATLTSDELGSGNYVGSMFVEKAGGANYNIYIFVRNETAELTRLIVFTGNGDGTFNDPTLTEYDHHYFAAPIFASTGSTDTAHDLLMAQTTSNNVAIYSSGSNRTYNGTPTYFGIDGTPSQVFVGGLDGVRGPELIVYDEGNNTISVLVDR